MKVGWIAGAPLFFAVVLSFAAHSADLADAVRRFQLSPPEPPHDATRAVRIGLYFSTDLTPDADATILLLDATGRALGPRLGEVQFCDAAMAGAVIIAHATYRVTGTGRAPQANCKRVFSRFARRHPVSADALGRSRFAQIDAAFGLGVHGMRLIPGRSIATDPDYIATGTVLYVPALRGLRVAGGALHDGYLFAADVGEGLQGEHIAWFAGLRRAASPDKPSPWQTSPAPAGRVDARIVADPAITEALARIHRIP